MQTLLIIVLVPIALAILAIAASTLFWMLLLPVVKLIGFCVQAWQALRHPRQFLM